MALTPLEGAVVLDHDTIPARFILQADGVHVYTQGREQLFLAASDALALAQAATSFYSAKVTTDGAVPVKP